MDLKITKLDGTSYTLGQYGVTVKDVIISPIEVEHDKRTIKGLHGTFDAGKTYKGRDISVPFVFVTDNLATYPLYRDLIYELVYDDEPFYIQEMRRPREQQYEFKDTSFEDTAIRTDQYGFETVFDSPQTENEISTGKRYLVSISECDEIDQKGTKGTGSLKFSTEELPFAESVGTSLDLERDGLDNVENPIWSYGMGLSRDPDTWNYTFDISKQKEHDVYNFGNVPIDQFNQHLVIRLTFKEEPSSVVRFGFNSTQCEIDTEKANIKKGDVVTYESGNYFKNGLNILNSTNYGIPVMRTGRNDFIFNDSYDIEAQVECRFYYL